MPPATCMPFCTGLNMLTHWGWDKMDAISQTTFSRAFSSMKIVVFWLNFHWNMFARVQLTIIHHWFKYWLGVYQAISHYLNQWWLVYRHIYASLGLNELIISISVGEAKPSNTGLDNACKLTIIGSGNGLPSHYLNQCWNIVNRTLGNKLQWNFNRNSYIFIQHDGSENVVWKMVAILCRPQCVNSLRPGDAYMCR